MTCLLRSERHKMLVRGKLDIALGIRRAAPGVQDALHGSLKCAVLDRLNSTESETPNLPNLVRLLIGLSHRDPFKVWHSVTALEPNPLHKAAAASTGHQPQISGVFPANTFRPKRLLRLLDA